jgi:hypothetical protein
MKVAEFFLALALLAGCGGGDDSPAPRDAGALPDAIALEDASPPGPHEAWVGTYRGTYEAIAHDCDTGDMLDTDPPYLEERELTFDGEALVFDAGCPVRFVILDDPWEAGLVRSTCEATLSNGSRANISFTDGEASLIGGEELWMRLEFTVDHELGCDQIATSFTEGQRL